MKAMYFGFKSWLYFIGFIENEKMNIEKLIRIGIYIYSFYKYCYEVFNSCIKEQFWIEILYVKRFMLETVEFQKLVVKLLF